MNLSDMRKELKDIKDGITRQSDSLMATVIMSNDYDTEGELQAAIDKAGGNVHVVRFVEPENIGQTWSGYSWNK